jgi:hypothetical protein
MLNINILLRFEIANRVYENILIGHSINEAMDITI